MVICMLNTRKPRKPSGRLSKKQKRDYECQQMHEIVASSELDSNFFWYLVNKSRKGQTQRVTPLKIGNDIITDPDEVRKAWKTYFEMLYTPKDLPHYDTAFKENIEHEVQQFIRDSFNKISHLLERSITSHEILKVVSGLKNKKAPGFDGITAEHVKYGGQKLLAILTSICNSISKWEDIPTQLKRGIIIPIPKGTKDTSIQNNNRGITLVSVIVKIYQKVVLKRHLDWAESLDKTDDLQGVGQPGCPSTHTAWLLRETIAASTEQDCSVYVTLLDTTKAFDTVWVQGLFHKLFKANMDCKVWNPT